MTYFESHFTIGSKNGFNETDSPNLFKAIEQSKYGKMQLQLAANWDNCQKGSDPEKIAPYAKDKTARDFVLATMSTNWSKEAKKAIRAALSFDSIADEKSVQKPKLM